MKAERRYLIVAVFTVAAVLFGVFLGPMDGFGHGSYPEEFDLAAVPEAAYSAPQSLAEPYEFRLIPTKDKLNGIQLYLAEGQEGAGRIICEVMENGIVKDTGEYDLNSGRRNTGCRIGFDKCLKKGREYTIRLSASERDNAPSLLTLSEDYLYGAPCTGNVLITCAYAKSTFLDQEKVLIMIFILSAWLCLAAFVLGIRHGFMMKAAVFLFLIVVLSWNYTHNSMNTDNMEYEDFGLSSEMLVSGMIYADRAGVYFTDPGEYGYGLGSYSDLRGNMEYSYDRPPVTDEERYEGYSLNESSVTLISGRITDHLADHCDHIEFANGDSFKVREVNKDDWSTVFVLDGEEGLSPLKYGSLDEAKFYDETGAELPTEGVVSYPSQYGLQGKIFKHLARFLDEEEAIPDLKLLCAVLAAAVFTLIVFVLRDKYNIIMAGCFFITFWLSPWIVNFATNLYWVEFTWFLPMLAGLLCVWKPEDKKLKIVSYIMAFVTVFSKSLCGYEYMTTVMLGLIAFPLAEMITAIFINDKKRAGRMFRIVFILGIVALASFAAAICLHAGLKGQGDIISGIKHIISDDMLRRTSGADLNSTDNEMMLESFNASIWETLCRYFRFSTDIITGIWGELFPLLCLIPICISLWDYREESLREESIRQLALYTVFFVTGISWFVLAKAHSYIHTHLNFVMWYFGFVQICFYIIVNKLACMYRKVVKTKSEKDGQQG